MEASTTQQCRPNMRIKAGKLGGARYFYRREMHEGDQRSHQQRNGTPFRGLNRMGWPVHPPSLLANPLPAPLLAKPPRIRPCPCQPVYMAHENSLPMFVLCLLSSSTHTYFRVHCKTDCFLMWGIQNHLQDRFLILVYVLILGMQ